MKALLPYVRPHRRTLYVAGVLALLGAAGGLAQPLAAREVIDTLATDDSLLVPLVVLGGLVAVSAAFSAAELWLLERTAERVVLGARRRLTGRMLRMPLVEFDRHAPGDLVTRATADATLLGSVASVALVQLVAGAVALVGAVVLMGVVDLVLLGVTAAVLVVIGGTVATLLPASCELPSVSRRPWEHWVQRSNARSGACPRSRRVAPRSVKPRRWMSLRDALMTTACGALDTRPWSEPPPA